MNKREYCNKCIHLALCFSVGFCSTGAHPPISALDAGQLHLPAQDCTLIGYKPQRPAHLVRSGWSLSHRVRLHQESHHSHPVSELKCVPIQQTRRQIYGWVTKSVTTHCDMKLLQKPNSLAQKSAISCLLAWFVPKFEKHCVIHAHLLIYLTCL